MEPKLTAIKYNGTIVAVGGRTRIRRMKNRKNRLNEKRNLERDYPPRVPKAIVKAVDPSPMIRPFTSKRGVSAWVKSLVKLSKVNAGQSRVLEPLESNDDVTSQMNGITLSSAIIEISAYMRPRFTRIATVRGRPESSRRFDHADVGV